MNIDCYRLEIEQVFKKLNTTENGLSHEEAVRRLKRYGKNEIVRERRSAPLILFFRQFWSPLIAVLMIVFALSLVLGHNLDAYIIFVVVMVNAVIGFYQEYKSEKAVEALKRMAAPKAEVIRDKQLMKLDPKNLVPGDIIVLEMGDRVPADARLIESVYLKTQEASLTGESSSFEKVTAAIDKPVSIGDRINMVYTSTTVTYGHGKGVVTSTGMNTEIGKIANRIREVKRDPTPLQHEIKRLTYHLCIFAIGIAIAIIFIGLLRGIGLGEIFMFSICSALSCMPEGLPAALSITLAVGVQRMAKRNAIVRKLAAVETLGCATIICTDKTGTLTQNKMTAVKIYTNNRTIDVTGHGSEPNGEFHYESETLKPLDDKVLALMLRAGILCNNATLQRSSQGWNVIGDHTEGALVVLAEKAQLTKTMLEQEELRIDELPFDSTRKYMATLHKVQNGNKRIFVKGAPEIVMELSQLVHNDEFNQELDEPIRANIQLVDQKMAYDGLRVLALAYKDFDNVKNNISPEDIERLVFLGLVGITDPPRKEVKEAIKQCKYAGIKVIMTTGDQPQTAIAIAKQVGILGDDYSEVLTGAEVCEMSDEELQQRIEHTTVFARVSPETKLRIVNALKREHHIVAMTGDGVNDAPALKRADIGTAMGLVGTEVAKESSDIILIDDNFKSITNAIEEGRVIFKNIQRAVAFLVTTNTAEAVTLVAAIAFGLPLPLIAVQILWINMVTDGTSVVPLGLERKHGDVLREKPRNPKERIISRDVIYLMIIMTALMCVGTLATYNFYLEHASLEKARTVAFTMIVMFQLFNVINCRSFKDSIFKIGLLSNKYIIFGLSFSLILQSLAIYTPFLQHVFGTVPLNILDWAVVIIVSSTVLIAGEVQKKVIKIFQ
jgi:Ca2+-transporting ATPase